MMDAMPWCKCVMREFAFILSEKFCFIPRNYHDNNFSSSFLANMKSFREKIQYNIKERRAFLCIGLDPRVEPNVDTSRICKTIVTENARIIRETSDVSACYKPNIAFYERWGAEGLKALKETLACIPSEIPVILDVKRSDIGATSEAYAYSAFAHFKVDAVTLSPYMGKESIEPFLSYDEAFVFVLVRTSNPSSGTFQMLQLNDGFLYERIATESAKWASAKQLGFVVASTELHALTRIRDAHPTRLLLCPGIGTQGGSVQACVKYGVSATGDTVLPVVSRSIANAHDRPAVALSYNEEVREAFFMQREYALQLKEPDEKKTDSARAHTSYSRTTALIDDLFRTSCFRLGSFTLKSGAVSPFYIDLRRIVSFPDMMHRVVQEYEKLVTPLSFQCIAGIPTAALPFSSALAYTRKIPMIYPRIDKKKHGSGNTIEGQYSVGQRVVLLDDLITHGTSKHEAIEILREAGMIVHDLVVFIRRSKHAEEDMRNLGITLHYTFDIEDIVQRGVQTGVIQEAEYQEIRLFLSS